MTDGYTKNLFARQKSLQDEGRRLLVHTQLLDVLEKFGDLLIEGSYAYGAMVDRDIDIRVILATGKPDKQYRNKVINSLLEMPDIGRLNIVDMANFFWSDDQKEVGIWLGPRIMFENNMWNVDIWLFDYKNGHKHLDLYNKMMNISNTDRQMILEIKEYCLNNNLKQKGSTSVDIYRAVLDEGVRTADEYLSSRNLVS
jgi:hypothetical protein